MAQPARWVILPGLAIPPEDMRELAYALDALVLNSWSLSMTRPAGELRQALRALPQIGDAPISLMGHSLGGLAAIEWAAQFPGEIERLVLLDPTPPIGRHPAVESALRIAEQAARPAIGLASLIAPFGPQLRRAGFKNATGREDLLPPDLAAEYFSRPRHLQLIMAQWLASYRQQARVRQSLRRLGDEMDILHLIGADSTQGYFARFQARLAEQIGSELILLKGHDHLFPLTHPELILSRL